MEQSVLQEMYEELLSCMDKLEGVLAKIETLESKEPGWDLAKYHTDNALSHLYITKEELENAI